MEIESFDVHGSAPSGGTFTATATDATPVLITSLKPGEWTIAVTARNSDGAAVGAGTAQTTIQADATNTLVVHVTPFEGFGHLFLAVGWNAADIGTPQVEATLTQPTGFHQTLEFTIDTVNGLGFVSVPDVPTGYHVVTVQLLDGGNDVNLGSATAVRIVHGEHTSGRFEFGRTTHSYGGVTVEITPEAIPGLAVEIIGAGTEKQLHEAVELNAVVTNESGPFTFFWFVNGVAFGGTPAFLFDDSWPVGEYTLDVAVITADGMSAGSASVTIDVTESDPAFTYPGESAAPFPGAEEYVLAGRWYSTDPDDRFTRADGTSVPPLGPDGLPDDPEFADQWHFLELAVPEVWQLVTAHASVTVAVVDTGVDQSLSDFSETVFVPGWNPVDGTDDTTDSIGHGTHVAGTIAQSTNNAYGLAGMAHGASIMPIKIVSSIMGPPDPAAPSLVVAAADGITWAVDNGAQIINLSWGIDLNADPADIEYLHDAVKYAVNENGVIVIASAGNIDEPDDPDNPPPPDVSIPAAFPEVIAVGATMPGGARAPYSAWGPGSELDIMAPGGCANSDISDLDRCGILQQTTGLMLSQAPLLGTTAGAAYWSGTSHAAPHVSALAALLRSLNRNLTVEQLRTAIFSTADEVTQPPGTTPEQVGAGVINPLAAVLSIEPDYVFGERWVIGGSTLGGSSETWRIRGDAGRLKMTGRVELLLRYDPSGDPVTLTVRDNTGEIVALSVNAAPEQVVWYTYDPLRSPYVIDVSPAE
ncbi:MAG: hypothetical protein EA426_10520 [Spirochaetaceae bacterium]|nr:MAG: hypothetical protein EA426_10520 [Spirochaetaceae bacterium]